MAHNSVYTVNGRLAQLENAVTELRKENAELRVHLKGALQTAINDAKHVIQDSIRVPADGKDGHDGRDGQSIVGPQGERGPAGDITIYGNDELREAVNVLRLKLARWQAAVQFAYEQNTGRTHKGLQSAIDATLRTIEKNAQ
jgi:hypothetical protein